MAQSYREYQSDADAAIYAELLVSNKCIVKMFCGTGKSLIMRRCKSAEDRNLVVYVFPSLSLITQFGAEYLRDFPNETRLNISSEPGATTDAAVLRGFLAHPADKIICIT